MDLRVRKREGSFKEILRARRRAGFWTAELFDQILYRLYGLAENLFSAGAAT
jgi:hypothetical protein